MLGATQTLHETVPQRRRAAYVKWSCSDTTILLTSCHEHNSHSVPPYLNVLFVADGFYTPPPLYA